MFMSELQTHTSLSILIGKTLKAIYRHEKFFGFECEEGNFAFMTYGQCCSSSWIENIDVLARLPAKVLEVDHRYGESSEFGIFIKIKTDKGYIDGCCDGGNTQMYSFAYRIVATDTLHDLLFAAVQKSNAWSEYNRIQSECL